LVWADVVLDGALAVSLVLSLVGVAASELAFADPGVIFDNVGAPVQFVSPTGFAWNDHVRPGEAVLGIADPEEPSDWWMTVQTPTGPVTTASAIHDHALRASLPVGIAGVVVSGLGFLLRSVWRRAAWATAAAGAMLGTTPLMLQGDPQVSTLALGVALVIPATGLLDSGIPRRIFGVGIAALVGFVALWTLERALAIGDPTGLETVRATVATALASVLGVVALLELRAVGRVRLRSRQAGADLAALATLVGVLAILALYIHVPDVILILAASLVAVAYPRSRHALLRAVDAAFLGGVRRQAAIEASEGERARLAADLHDVPIQELSAVIARLELLPEAAEERETLRRIAADLRALTSDLRPPVLDDLGLPMAIESLADQFARDGTALRVDVDDRTLPDAARDPMVELAIYRVTEEAVRNAMNHADAQRVDVTGVIADDRVEIQVRDDGRGLDARALEGARRAGHAGLIAMRHRAEAIGARLSLRSELGAGVSISLAWQR
jgi:signal transduction histidine kinase